MTRPAYAARKPLPFILAASKAQSWVEVLEIYAQCSTYLRGVYRPTTAELQFGLSQMKNSWSLSLFYYGIVKAGEYQNAAPPAILVNAALRGYKQTAHISAMRRIFEEDVNSETLDGAKTKMALASFAGMWEVALATLISHRKLYTSPIQRRSVLTTLAAASQWELALKVMDAPPRLDRSPVIVRPLVAFFGRTGKHDVALRFVASCLAGGYKLDLPLLASVISTLQMIGKWSVALEVAHELNVFSATRTAVQKSFGFYSRLVDCLYESDPYHDFSVQDVVTEMAGRMSPREDQLTRSTDGPRYFRLRTHAEIYYQFQTITTLLNQVLNRAFQVPRLYTRSLLHIINDAVGVSSGSSSTDSRKNTSPAVILIVDTNFILQLVSKNLPLSHFLPYIKKQHPSLESYSRYIVVVPFTVIEETYGRVWSSRGLHSQAVKLLLWSRVMTFLRDPCVYPLSLGSEFPSTSLGMISRMAYAKMTAHIAGAFQHDPDLRVLNVCLSLQHMLRGITLNSRIGVPPPEGIQLFAFLKYHVRRYCNTVKGLSSDQLLLCTLDRRLSGAATELGISVFPVFQECEEEERERDKEST